MKKIFLLVFCFSFVQSYALTEIQTTSECILPSEKNITFTTLERSCPEAARQIKKDYFDTQKKHISPDIVLQETSLLQSGQRICRRLCVPLVKCWPVCTNRAK